MAPPAFPRVRRTPPWRRPLFALLFLGLLLSAACVQPGPDADDLPQAHAGPPPLPPGTVQLTAAQEQALGIATQPVSLRRLPPVYATTAVVTVPTGAQAEVVSPVSGYVQVPAGGMGRLGQRVRAGQVLALVRQAYTADEKVGFATSERQAQAALQAAAAQLQLAQAEANRERQLYRDQVISLRELQQSEAAVGVQQAALAGARSLARQYAAARAGTSGAGEYALRAPIAGVVTQAQLAPGALVDPNQTLFTVVNQSRLWVSVPLPEQNLRALAQAQSAEVSAAAFPGQVLFRRIPSPGVVDPLTHTLPLLFAAPGRAGGLRPGMSVAVRLLGGPPVLAAVVPARALVLEAGATVLFVRTGPHRYLRLPVHPRYQLPAGAVLADALPPGTQVVVHGAAQLESDLQKTSIQLGVD